MEEEEKILHKNKKKKRISFWYIITGGVLKTAFVIKHIRMIILIVILSFFFVGNRLTCMSKLRKINELQKQLEYIKYESIDISGQLTGSNRLSQVEQLVRNQGLGLESAKSPPYIIRK
jgi:uncharacterized membrane protein YciS (DUF1049 family)